MTNVWFTSDPHWGHDSITKHRAQFPTAEHHHEYMVDMMCRRLGQRDTLWILGDICFTVESLKYLRRVAEWCYSLRVIPGNHCIDSRHYVDIADRINAFQEYKHFWITHCPIHPAEIRGKKGVIHGHVHSNVIPDLRYYSVCPESHDFEMVDLNQIKDEMEQRKRFLTFEMK